MKKKSLFIAVFLFLLTFGVVFTLVADDEVVIPTAESVAPAQEEVSDGSSFGGGLWTFLNSSLGVSIVVFILSFVLGKIFTAKPKWKQLVLKYGPTIMQAIKSAEKKIPDDTENKGLARLDHALKYLIEIEPKLKGIADSELKNAIAAVHTTAETNGNLKKE